METYMNNKLSHSSVTTYKECPKKFELHYKQKLRSETTSSALLFGSAIDKSLELGLKQFPNCDMNEMNKEFIKHWTFAELNGKSINIPESNLIKYSKSDYELNENPWESLKSKGLLMIQTFANDVVNNIEEVVAIQKEIILKNDNEDAITGFADSILKWKGYDGNIIFDFKTGARSYPKNSAKESPQLALYKHALNEEFNIIKVGYIVFIKTINKNASKICTICGHDGSATSHKTCNGELPKQFSEGVRMARCGGELKITYNPKIDVQVIIDEIDEKFENSLLESFDDINVKLQEEVFEQNWDNCFGKYGPCVYMNYCKSGDMTGLVVLTKKETK